jgi:YVTN family beta-propeller protein
MQKTVLIFILLLMILSCTDETGPVILDQGNNYLSGRGTLVINEGNFRSGNGSLSFFSYDSLKIYNNVFLDINKRPLGDIPYSISIMGGKAYIVVNNSGKIEVVNSNDLKSLATISGIVSPRYISFINNRKAYVTSLYSDSVTILDLSANTISGYINIKRPSEGIVNLNSNAYVAHWTGGNKIIVIDTETDQVTDSIEVGMEPESMVIDKNEMLWVLCNGGWKREYSAELIAIDTRTNTIEKRLIFPLKTDSPTCLQIDKKGETLYYIHDGIRRMDINSTELASGIFIQKLNHTFYKMGINPDNDEIFITDVVDYVQKGNILRYKNSGNLVSAFQVDIIPGGLCFKANPDTNTE